MENLNALIVKWAGPVRVAEAHELDALTGSGWKILAVYEEDHLEVAYDQEPNPNPREGSTDYNYASTLSVNRSHRCRRAQFLLGYETGSHRAEQASRIEQMAKDLKEATSGLEEALKEQKKVEEDRDRLKRVSENSSVRVNELLDEVKHEQARVRRIEGDMAKVRQAVGDLRWREITAPEETSA